MRYSGPVDDPWFEAHEAHSEVMKIEYDARENVTWYYPKYPVSVVGCACQYQFCGPTATEGTVCTPLTGMDTAVRLCSDILRFPRQRAALRRIVEVIGSIGDMSRLATTLVGNVLLANHFGPIEEHPLPNDQWIRELNHMFGTLMTVLQIRNYRFAGGYDPQFEPKVTPPRANDTWMCGNQMVRRNDYQSFSVLGLGIIVGLGGFIILVNMTLSEVVGMIQKRYHKHGHGRREWNLLKTETLQLLAYSAQGVDMLSGLNSIQPALDATSCTVPNTTQESKQDGAELVYPTNDRRMQSPPREVAPRIANSTNPETSEVTKASLEAPEAIKANLEAPGAIKASPGAAVQERRTSGSFHSHEESA
jgi:hypothetical protein